MLINVIDSTMIKNKAEKKLVTVFLINGRSSTVIIPIKLARKYGIDKPSHVFIQDTDNGILIRKARIED